MNILCVIPVRGGSKGIPRKNIRDLAGKPLVSWTIEQALAADCGLDVLVSTDDHEIAEVALQAGADVPFLRPEELARDEAATEPVVQHAIEYRTAQGREPDAVMLLQATSPIRHPGTLDRAVAQFLDSRVDSLVGVVPQTPFLWTAGDPPMAQYAVDRRPRRQDLAEGDYRYRETGSLYLTRTEIYRKFSNRLGGRIGLFVMEEAEGVDIDTELDFSTVEQQMLVSRQMQGTEKEARR
ncbi:acylneuraminate cytidylyltransferase family protein [Arthrobacter sp. AB6]|uniref:acylneuraminate cytidylyltransferase family protein n=1 Tax=Arthrobacter sp. AB6 TaxID=2962570 RepID=UPI002881F25E|nr:acylneuraminate cytidylyltransferase family protein [Arthrobacter sp. AB6]MDT0193773.1 acylneuraminate cytidylyltransferase family protein [Arthrobacter sp. AB6]